MAFYTYLGICTSLEKPIMPGRGEGVAKGTGKAARRVGRTPERGLRGARARDHFKKKGGFSSVKRYLKVK